MSKITVFSALFALIGVTLTSFALEKDHDWAHEISDLDSDSRVVYGKLDNGFRYAFIHNENLPKQFGLRLYVNAGSLMEEENERGLAHFLEHMAFKGIRGYPEDSMIQTLQKLGVSFGSHTNAYTSFAETVYMLDVLDNSHVHLEHCMKILSGIADGMLLDEDLIQKEIGVILSEKRDRDSAGMRMWHDYKKHVYGGTRLLKRLPIGLEKVIKSANSKLLGNFYRKWYTPDRMLLVVVGDLDQEDVESAIEHCFSGIKKSEIQQDPYLGELSENQGLRARLYEDNELGTEASLEIYSVRPYQKSPSNKNSRREIILREIASSILNTRLDELAKKEDTPFNKGEFARHVRLDAFEHSSIELECQPEEVLEAIEAAENELRRVLTYGFTDDEFELEKKDMLLMYFQSANTAETKQTESLLNGLLNTLTIGSVYTSPQFDYEFAKEVLEDEMAMDDCLQLFRDSWDVENLGIYVFTNGKVSYDEQELINTYRKSSKKILSPPVARDIPEFHYDLGETHGTILHEEYDSELDCYFYRLSNRIRVNLKQTDFVKDQLDYIISFGHGTDEPGGELPALTDVAGFMISNGGIGSLTNDELSRAFMGSDLKIPELSVWRDEFTISSFVRGEDFEKQMEVISGLLMNPGFHDDSLSQFRTEINNEYDSYNTTIQGVNYFEINPFMSNNHPIFAIPSREDKLARTPQEAAQWLNKPLNEGYMEITVVGDFDKDAVLESLLNTLGALPNRDFGKQCFNYVPRVAFKSGKSRYVFEYQSKSPLALSKVIWAFPQYDNDNLLLYKNYVRASLLAEVLTERLRQKVRMELGEGYSPYAYVRASGIAAYSMTDPKKADMLSTLVEEISDDLIQNSITEDEFQRAITPILLEQESDKATNFYWKYELHGLKLMPKENAEALELMKDYWNEVTLSEVNEAANEFLGSAKATRIIVTPSRFRHLIP